MSTQIFFDGGLRPHPNGGFAACYGWVVKHGNAKVADGCGMERYELNVGSCAVEYNALIHAMESAIRQGLHKNDEVVIRGDSQVVINMAAGKAAAQTEMTVMYCDKVKSLSAEFNNLRFEWVPRKLNQEADQLGRVAFAECDEIKRRVVLINKVHALSRRAFGELYDNKIASAWHEMVTGKKRFAMMCEDELLKLLAHIKDIPLIISGVLV